jgi:LPXTG-motif cell wall-anchored protein
VNYAYGATGVTYNEPSESIAIEAFAALGFAATAIGGGIYYLTRKKKKDDDE